MSSISKKSIIEAIISLGSITAAAESLYVTQPYISRILKEIEEELGAKLFERRYREMKLTQAGEIYLAFLEKVDVLHSVMLDQLSSIAKEKKGLLRIGINPMLSPIFLPAIYPIVTNTMDKVEFKFVENTSKVLLNMLNEGDLDLLFGIGNEDSNFETIHVFDSSMCLIASESSSLFQPTRQRELLKNSLDMKQLHNLPVILLNEHYVFRKIIDTAYFQENISINCIHETSNTYTAIGMVQKGIGNMFLPKVVTIPSNFNKCSIYEIAEPSFTIEFVFYRNPTIQSPSYLDEFIEQAGRTLHEHYTQPVMVSR
ncbi:TPA: LysR family transcriptional regulator [Streptococcus suis]